MRGGSRGNYVDREIGSAITNGDIINALSGMTMREFDDMASFIGDQKNGASATVAYMGWAAKQRSLERFSTISRL